MDLTREIRREHGRKQATKIAAYAGTHPSRFKSLVDIYLAGPYRITQRASWPLTLCAEAHPELIRPHLRKLLDFLRQPRIHDAVKRNTMRLLQFVDIPKRNRVQVIDLCFDLLQQPKEAVAIRVFAMTALSRVIVDEPDLQKELLIILEDQFPYGTAAFRSRASKLIKKLSASVNIRSQTP
jgi:hypothetical protein